MRPPTYGQNPMPSKHNLEIWRAPANERASTQILDAFLQAHKQRVAFMLDELFNEEALREAYDLARERENLEKGRAQGREEGRAQGREEGRELGLKQGTLFTLADLVQDGLLTLTQAARKVKMTEEEFEVKVKALQSELQSI